MGWVSPMRAAAAIALASLLGSWMSAASLRAGEARLVEGRTPDHIVVETSDATADEVLAVLARHFEFSIERGAPPSQSLRFSVRLQGSLDEVLERLLRHEGHMIVRSAEARAGISRVLILQAKGGASGPTGAPAPTLPNPIAALKARLQSGEEEGAGK